MWQLHDINLSKHDPTRVRCGLCRARELEISTPTVGCQHGTNNGILANTLKQLTHEEKTLAPVHSGAELSLGNGVQQALLGLPLPIGSRLALIFLPPGIIASEPKNDNKRMRHSETLASAFVDRIQKNEEGGGDEERN